MQYILFYLKYIDVNVVVKYFLAHSHSVRVFLTAEAVLVITFTSPHPPPLSNSTVTPSEIPWRVNNRVGSSKQKLLLRVGLPEKFDLGGAHPNPGPTGSTPPNGDVCNENRVGASKQKLLLAVGLQSKILFLRVHLTLGPTGFTYSKGGVCSSLFLSLEICPSRSCLYLFFNLKYYWNNFNWQFQPF